MELSRANLLFSIVLTVLNSLFILPRTNNTENKSDKVGPTSRILAVMTGKLAKQRKEREAHRKHTGKVLAAVDEKVKDYDGFTGAKDRVKRIIISLNDIVYNQ